MNCLRCGREIPEDWMFCDECWEKVRQPLEPSPYLNTQIQLPNRSKQPVKAAPTRGSKRAERRFERAENGTGGSALTVFLGVLCVLAIGFGLVMSLLYLDQRSDSRQEIAEISAERDGLQERIDFVGENYVLVDPKGEPVYHRPDCPLADPQTAQILRLNSALYLDYQPCPECH